jgi:hypothetical protein
MSVHDNRIKQALIELDCDQACFAGISGINQTRLSQAFRGTRDFSNVEIVKLNALIEELREIVAAAAPFPVSFRNVSAVQRILMCRREGVKWSISVREVEEPVR